MLRGAAVVAVLATALCSFPVLMPTDITSTPWRLHNDTGLMGWVTFNSNGTINAAFSVPAHNWSYNAEEHTLIFTDANGRGTARFSFAGRDYYLKWRLRARDLSSPTPAASFYLEQML